MSGGEGGIQIVKKVFFVLNQLVNFYLVRNYNSLERGRKFMIPYNFLF